MARSILGAFTVDTERDADLIALFEQAKKQGRSQSDLFREMGRVYQEKKGQLGIAITYMLFIIDELAEMKKIMQSGVVVRSNAETKPGDGLEAGKRDRLKNLGLVE